MKRFLILLVTLIMAVLPCINISAEEVLTVGALEQPRLIDDADLLTDSEIEKLSERLDSISEEHKVDFVIMTVIDSSIYEIENYMRSICLDYGYGYGDTNDCVMVMVNLGTRKFRVVSYGLAAEAISIDSCDDIEIEMESDLSNGDYYDAFEIFIKESEYLINGHINGFPWLIDDAGVLNDSEIDKLSAKLDSISEKHKVDFVIMTVIDSSIYEIENYMRSICLDYGYGYGDTNDCVMVMVNLGTRKFRVVSYGLAAEAISIDSCDDIEIEMESDLSNGDYYDAFEIFIEESEYLINGHINGFPFKLAQNLLISIGVGLVVALIATLVMKSQLKSVREQKTANLYTRSGSMNLRVQNDLFLYSTVTRVKIQKTSSGSSSGGSRGGGGRSF